MGWVDFQRDLPTRANRLHRLRNVRDRGEPFRIARRADVDGEEYLAGNDVGRAGKRLELAHGTYQLGHAGATPLDHQHAFSGGSERVLAQIHRHRAGMACHAVDFDQKAVGAVDGRHNPDGKAFGLQYRALFDVQFRVRQHVVTLVRGASDLRGVESEMRQGLPHADTLVVDLLQQRRLKRPGNRPAAQQRGAKANALLVGKAQYFDGEGQTLALLVQRMHAFDRGDDAEHAVVFAGIAYRVEMRAEHEARRPRSVALVTADA